MAKSARSSSTKTNKAILRRDVFQPRDEERTQRLHDKLMASIATAQDNKAEMEIEKPADDLTKASADDTSMDIDADAEVGPISSGKGSLRSRGKITKRRNQKPRNAIRFTAKIGSKRKGRK